MKKKMDIDTSTPWCDIFPYCSAFYTLLPLLLSFLVYMRLFLFLKCVVCNRNSTQHYDLC